MASQLSARTLAVVVVLLLLSTVFSVINIYFIRKAKNDRKLLLGNRSEADVGTLGKDASMWAYGLNVLSIFLVLGVVGLLLYNFYAKAGTAKGGYKALKERIDRFRKKSNQA